MFKISQALKKTVAVGAFAALAILLVPASGRADSATFAWTDSGNTSITADGGSLQGKVQLAAAADTTTPDGKPAKAFKTGATLSCGGKSTSVTLEVDVASSDYQKTYPTPALAYVTEANDPGAQCAGSGIDNQVTVAAATGNASQDNQCDQGGSSWLVCPLMQKISEAVSTISQKVLTPLLEVKPISAQNTPGLYQAWTNIRHLAEVLFVFIFMAAIFSSATTFGLDSYTVKRILPRLFAAAILIEFSFFISSFIVDMGNILGGGIQDLILANFQTGTMQADQSVLANLTQISALLAVGGIAIFASYIMALPVLALLLISTLAFLLTLAARYMIIAVLVAVAPLAILAWVLPNTSRYFSKWFSTFIRLILMYPIIIGILAIGRRVTEIFGFTDQATTNTFTNVLTDLLKPFIIIALFMAIPATFKWAGGLMATTHGTFQKLAARGRKQVKESDWYKERREDMQTKNLDRMKRFNDSKITGMQYLNNRAGKPGKAVAGFQRGIAGALLMGAPSTDRALEKEHSKHVNAFNKELGELEAAQDVGALMNIINASYGSSEERAKAMRALEMNTPELLRYTKTQAGRMAVLKQLADKGLVSPKMMDNIAKFAPHEFGEAKQAAGKNFKGKPVLFTRWSEGEIEVTDDGRRITHHAGEVNTKALRGVVGNWDIQTIKNDVAPDNWDVAREDPEISAIFADVHDPLTYEGGLSDNSRTRFQRAKRLAILKWAASRRDGEEFKTEHGRKILRAITKQVKKGHNDDIYEDLIKFAWEGDDKDGRAPYRPDFTEYYHPDPESWSQEERHNYLQNWLGVEDLPEEDGD